MKIHGKWYKTHMSFPDVLCNSLDLVSHDFVCLFFNTPFSRPKKCSGSNLHRLH